MTTHPTDPKAGGPLAGWDWFWFHPRNPATLCLIRIFTGLILLYIHFCYSFSLMEFVHPTKGWVDREMFGFMRMDTPLMAPSNGWEFEDPPRLGPAPSGQPRPDDPFVAKYRLAYGQYLWSVFFHVDNDAWIWAIHLAFFVPIVLFTLGLWTRLTTVLAWAITLQYIHRSPVTQFGQDSMTMLGLFFLMIGPAGAKYSLDHWLAQRRERLRRGDPTYVLPVAPSVLANVAIRMMQVQFCAIYLASGTSKLLGSSWWNGTAIWNTVANYEFAPFYLDFYEPMLRSLTAYRPVWELAMTGGVVFTLILEIGFPFLVWFPKTRGLCVAGAVLLHTGIGVLMGLVSFSLMMITLVASFIPSSTVEQALGRLFGVRPIPAAPEPAAEPVPVAI